MFSITSHGSRPKNSSTSTSQSANQTPLFSASISLPCIYPSVRYFFFFFFSFSSFNIYFISILSNPMGPSEFSLILICAQRMTPTASARESDVREDSRPLYVPKPISTATGCRGHASFLATVSICRRPSPTRSSSGRARRTGPWAASA